MVWFRAACDTCANEVVAGVPVSTLPPNICPVNTRQFA